MQNKTKRIIILRGFLILFLFLCVSFFTESKEVFAAVAEEEAEVEGVVLADVSLYNLKTEQSQSGVIKISYDIVNNGDVQNNLKTTVMLMRVLDKSRITMDSWSEEAVFQAPKGTLNRSITYNAPSFFKGEYELMVSVSNISGMMYAITSAGKVTLNGSGLNVLLESDKCYLTVEGDKENKKYQLSVGVDIDKNEVLLGHCPVKNLSDKNISGQISFESFWRSGSGKSLPTPSVKNDQFSIASGESKEIVFIIPTIQEPQAYNAVAYLKNEKNEQISNKVISHYVARGISATIQQAQYELDDSKKTVSISFDWTPSADSHLQSRSNDQQVINKYFVQVKAEGSLKKVCATGEKKELDPTNLQKEKLSLTLPDGCENPILRLSLMDSAGNVLDEQVLNAGDKKNADKPIIANNAGLNEGDNSGEKSSTAILLIKIISIITLILIIAILIFKYKRKSLMLLVLFAASLFFGHSASAKSWSDVVCDSPTHCITLTSIASLSKTEYERGESLVLNYTMYDSRCNDGVFVGSKLRLRVFGSYTYDYVDDNTEGGAELIDGMQGAPLSLSVPVPNNQAPGNYNARVCTKIMYANDGYDCVNLPFKVKDPAIIGSCKNFPSGIDNPSPSQVCLTGQAPAAISGLGTNNSPWSWKCLGQYGGANSDLCTAKKTCVYNNHECKRALTDTVCAQTYPENCGKSLPVNKICIANDVNSSCSGALSQRDCEDATGLPCVNSTETCASCPLGINGFKEVNP